MDDKPKIEEFNGESCSWCENEGKACNLNKRRTMEATREAVKNVIHCTSAYCSGNVKCDYYKMDKDKFYKYNQGEINVSK